MFYLGMRSSDLYLKRLASIRDTDTPCDVLTVAGGIAFLHAISNTTRSLTIVDTDRDTLLHWALIRALLIEAASLTDFLTLLGGRVATGSFAEGSVVFGPKVDLRRRLASALSAEERAVYDRTYGALTVDEFGIGRDDRSTVRFVGMDFRVNVFNWRFGLGNLANESRFAVVRAQVPVVPTRVEQAYLESLDYDAEYPATPGRTRVCLASNCESPVFTQADAIFLRVMATARTPVRFLSWHRDVVVASGGVVSGPSGEDAPAAEIAAEKTVVFPDGRGSAPTPALRFARTIHGVADLRAKPEYGWPLLLVLGQTNEEVRECLRAVAPAFKQVLWVPADGTLPSALDFSLPNYRARSDTVLDGRAAWRFSLVGCP